MPQIILDDFIKQIAASMSKEDMANFRAERKRALEHLDAVWARNQCEFKVKISDRALEIWMHKARYECPEVDRAYRFNSKAWLGDRGYGGFNGPLLPHGELPE